jgi:hypothetical protein
MDGSDGLENRQATMLDTFATSGGRQTGVMYLLGNNNRPMGYFQNGTAP